MTTSTRRAAALLAVVLAAIGVTILLRPEALSQATEPFSAYMAPLPVDSISVQNGDFLYILNAGVSKKLPGTTVRNPILDTLNVGAAGVSTGTISITAFGGANNTLQLCQGGALQVLNQSSGTAFCLPSSTGTVGQVLTSSGSATVPATWGPGGGGGGGGTISSIALSVPQGLSISGSPCSIANCTFGMTWNASQVIPNTQIPTPTLSALGGIEAITCAAGQFINVINVTGIPTCSTPAGGGNVSTSGTITSGNCAQWNSATGLISTAAPCASGPAGANPTATIGLAAVNGVATSFIRSDGAPPLSQAIVPTWTGLHTFAGNMAVNGSGSGTITLQPQAAAGTWSWNWPITAGAAGQVLTSQGGGSTAMTWTTAGIPTPIFQTISGTSPQSATITTASYIISTVTGGSPNSVTVTLPASPATGTTLTFTLGNTQATNIVSASSNILPIESTTTDTVIIGTPSTGVAVAEWASIVYSGTNWEVVAGGSTGGGGGTPSFQTYQTFLSGSGASYTATSSAVLHIKVKMIGGGGGGGAQTANAGGNGAATSFGGWSAGGGTGGPGGPTNATIAGGTGGSNGSGTQILRLNGGTGTSGTTGVSGLTPYSPAGCTSPFGGTAGGATNKVGDPAAANTGSGGAGGGGQGSTGAGSSGACGEYVEFIMTKAQFAGATYTIGGGGAAGAAGSVAGGAGAAGIVMVEEFYY